MITHRSTEWDGHHHHQTLNYNFKLLEKKKTKKTASAFSSVFNNWLKPENLNFIKDTGKDIYEVQEHVIKPQPKY